MLEAADLQGRIANHPRCGLWNIRGRRLVRPKPTVIFIGELKEQSQRRQEMLQRMERSQQQSPAEAPSLAARTQERKWQKEPRQKQEGSRRERRRRGRLVEHQCVSFSRSI